MTDRSPELPESDLNMKKKLSDRMTTQLLNSVIAKYRDLSVSRRSRYFAQPCPIIVKYLFHIFICINSKYTRFEAFPTLLCVFIRDFRGF